MFTEPPPDGGAPAEQFRANGQLAHIFRSRGTLCLFLRFC